MALREVPRVAGVNRSYREGLFDDILIGIWVKHIAFAAREQQGGANEQKGRT
jgi:hypothetical protein